MTKIKPIKAVLYNKEEIPDLSSVICPPYDVISSARQDYFHQLDPYNFIHIILGKETPGEDKYRNAGLLFNEWLKKKILIQDDKPSIYFYNQEYKVKGENKTRLGFIALLHLGDKKSPVFGHENTHVAPREDRLKLLRQVKANLSPIFVLFADKKRVIKKIQQEDVQNKKPLMEARDDEGVVHKLWKIEDPGALKEIVACMNDENIFIADGHHRFEVSCSYREEIKQKLNRELTGEEDCNYILAYFTNMDSRGLTIMPIHRLVNVGSGFDLDAFLEKMKQYFSVEEMKDKARLFFLMEKAGMNEHVIGLYKNKKYFLLRLKNVKILDKIIADKAPEYRSLDVAILNYMILKDLVELDFDNKSVFTFSPDAEECIEKVDGDSSRIAFFLNPTKVQQITAIALKGEKMPQKSTYFYPKVASGLVVNKHNDSK
ncbi:MAG: DUF1015 domain-containing protein [Candidatus Omnitrophica bacterium]|nr:DUF1015 domain-containing protein [Candidatus Omnitrophota bacterium]